jgi:hypothetical protein
MVSISVSEIMNINLNGRIGVRCRGKRTTGSFARVPYFWVQFNNATANMLIDVVCRAFGENIHFDKIKAMGSTRFQLFINDTARHETSITNVES